MLVKIKLGTCLMALILFAFPWFDIQCSEKTLATQTGFQVITGQATPGEEFPSSDSPEENKEDDSLGYAPLVGISLLAVIAAFACALVTLINGNRTAETISSILPAIALGLLLIQMMLGFPAKNEIRESISKDSTDNASVNDPYTGMGDSMAAAMMSSIQVKTKPAFYLELFALSIPTLLLANSLINRLQKTKPSDPA